MEFKRSIFLLAVVAASVTASGCASYRVSSNVKDDAPPMSATAQSRPVLLAEDAMADRKYTAISPVEVTVKKLTAFHPNPTKEQANEALTQRARVLGADAVVNVKYDFGIGWTTWGYMEAKGTAVRFNP